MDRGRYPNASREELETVVEAAEKVFCDYVKHGHGSEKVEAAFEVVLRRALEQCPGTRAKSLKRVRFPSKPPGMDRM